MTDSELLKIYIPLVDFLAELCGASTEVVLHDVSSPDSSVIAIRNSHSGRSCGAPLTEFGKQLVEDPAKHNKSYITNYGGYVNDEEFLSSTFFIKNEGRLIGLLCVNRSMNSVKNLNTALKIFFDQYNLIPSKQGEPKENLDTPVAATLHSLIEKSIVESGIPPTRMTLDEKVQIVHRMNEQGILTIKGAVSEIALHLNISEPTVYRYLNRGVVKK